MIPDYVDPVIPSDVPVISDDVDPVVLVADAPMTPRDDAPIIPDAGPLAILDDTAPRSGWYLDAS